MPQYYGWVYERVSSNPEVTAHTVSRKRKPRENGPCHACHRITTSTAPYLVRAMYFHLAK